jgi:threonyl-tRNA synthetase
MLHRVILGAIERFMGVLIEQYTGAFPVWLSPTQAIVLTVTDKHIPYAQSVYDKLMAAGIRCEKCFDNEKLGYKIRQSQMQKIPYMLVIGDKEVATETVAPRERDGNNLTPLSVVEFIVLVQDKCEKKL